MLNFLTLLYQTINTYQFVFSIELISFATKSIFFYVTIVQGLRSHKKNPAWVILLLVYIGSMFSNIAWIASLSHKLFLQSLDYRSIIFIIRIAWAFAIIFYQGLANLIESLSSFNAQLRWHQKIFMSISSFFVLGFFYIAVFEFNTINPRPKIEELLITISPIYTFIIIIPSILLVMRRIYTGNLPKILRKQLKILIAGIICPVILADFIQMYPFAILLNHVASNLAVVSFSTLLITYGFYYTVRRIMGLRFLNFQHHVKSLGRFNFIDDFKLVLGQLSYVTNLKELGHITQTFFKDAFNIPPSRTRLYIRNIDTIKEISYEPEITAIETIIENFVGRHDNNSCTISSFFRKTKIAIYDELAFTDFYEQSETRKDILSFLNHINADVFLPIYDKNTIVACIVIERDARVNEFYSDVERDEMVVFASYLGNIINLQQNGNIDAIIQREKETREELYRKHQEINQYKESIHSFLRDSNQRKIGIIFYKNRQFIMGNNAAQELIQINPNKQEGHPIALDLKTLIQQIETYRSGQLRFTKDIKGNKLILSGLPHLEQNTIIITVYYPEIADVIKKQIDLLKNPSEWDYLLYLETTKSGQLINQLIPGSGEHLLNFKIELLKTSLSKKALLLEMPDEDLLPTIEILHHISLRETLHILHLKAHEQRNETAIKLFGINPIFGTQHGQPLLEKLNNIGTLFIYNIHFLDIETQHYLAEFLKYGYFHIFKSDRKISSNIRIICSTNQNLQTLVQEGKFSRALFNELKQTTLSMPSLLTLPEKELDNLVEGLTEQATRTQDFRSLLQLTEKEKNKLFTNRPVSLHEFKHKIQQTLLQKSKKNNIFHETQFDPAYQISDPDLTQAARLGKRALKDPKIMSLLWTKFEKNQNRIATFLGVNRSSVNRRCKDYNLQ